MCVSQNSQSTLLGQDSTDRCPRRISLWKVREAGLQTRFYLPGRKVVKEDDILDWSDI